MRHFALLLFSAVLFSGCVKNNPKPVWLAINAWTQEANTDPTANNAGDLTCNFSDAWVYIDNKLIGVFQVPCTIPVLVSGNKQIRIYPTVRNNGISATKKIYPFCESYTTTLDLVEGQTYTINPVTHYFTNCDFWIEEFDDVELGLTIDNNSNASLVRENDPAIAITGYYGHIHLTSSDSLWQATTQYINLPQSGAEVYLEMDYRNDNGLVTGLFAYSQASGLAQYPNIGLNAQETSSMKWKKIYIDLKEIVSYATTANSFSQYIRAIIDDGESQGDIYIDNIRLVYFN